MAVQPMSAAERSFRPGGVVFWTAIALLTAGLVFVLPLWVMLPRTGYYSAFTVGFSNRLAAMATVGISLLVTTLFILRGEHKAASYGAGRPLPLRYLMMACTAAAVYTTVFGWLVWRSGGLTPDSDYFLSRLAELRYVHGNLYRDAEFAYGPLLFWMVKATTLLPGLNGRDLLPGYLLAELLGQVGGMLVAFALVQSMVRDSSLRRGFGLVALVLLEAVSLRPDLGLNYTMLRFATPLLLLLWAGRAADGRRRALLFCVGQVVTLLLSPEMGLAFLAGSLGVSSVYVLRRGAREALPLTACFGSLAAFLWLADARYLYGLKHFAAGMLNLVVAPEPHILVLLVAAIGLAPLAVARRLRGPVEGVAGIAGMYVASLALLSAALGLCDELHTSFNGVGMYVLSLLAISDCWAEVGSHRRTALWAAVLLLFVAVPPVIDSVQAIALARMPATPPDAGERESAEILAHLSPGERVYAPAGLPGALREQLMRAGRWVPAYFDGMDNAYDRAADEMKARETEGAAVVVLPDRTPPGIGADNRRRSRLLRFGYVYRAMRVPYDPLLAVRAALQQHFVRSGTLRVDGQEISIFQRKEKSAEPAEGLTPSHFQETIEGLPAGVPAAQVETTPMRTTHVLFYGSGSGKKPTGVADKDKDGSQDFKEFDQGACACGKAPLCNW